MEWKSGVDENRTGKIETLPNPDVSLVETHGITETTACNLWSRKDGNLTVYTLVSCVLETLKMKKKMSFCIVTTKELW